MKKSKIDKLFDLTNRTVILTGSSGRIGTHYAHILSEAGANVVLVDINKKENEKLEKELRKKYNTNPCSFETDISKKPDLEKLKNQVLENYKTIDILINNAFFNPSINQKQNTMKFEKFPIEIWNQVLHVNLTGVFLCCQIFGSVMAKQKNGVIVNISSTYGLVGADQRIYGNSGLNSQISYAATKSAIVNLTRYLAAYWHRKNVRVNTLSLGGVEDRSYMNKTFIKNYSEKTILGRMAKKDEYQGSLLYLVSDASSYMTGSNLIVDGGWTAW